MDFALALYVLLLDRIQQFILQGRELHKTVTIMRQDRIGIQSFL